MKSPPSAHLHVILLFFVGNEQRTAAERGKNNNQKTLCSVYVDAHACGNACTHFRNRWICPAYLSPARFCQESAGEPGEVTNRFLDFQLSKIK